MSRHPGLDGALLQFNLTGNPTALPGGTTGTSRAGEVVLKHIHETSLENNHSPGLAEWIAGFSDWLPQDGFRVPRPIATRDGRWITPDGWTAWTFLEGRHATQADIPECIEAILTLHRALKPIPRHPLMDDNRTEWGYAQQGCWGEPPDDPPKPLRPLLDRLYALREPVEGLDWQLMHGDLNPENILIAPRRAPAILDLSPFWGPPEFALAIFANFIGPRRGEAACLRFFEGIPNFKQLLVRAGIRMLLVMAAGGKLTGWETCSEKRAAEIILAYATSQVQM